MFAGVLNGDSTNDNAVNDVDGGGVTHNVVRVLGSTKTILVRTKIRKCEFGSLLLNKRVKAVSHNLYIELFKSA
jgi:hypothetical protein